MSKILERLSLLKNKIVSSEAFVVQRIRNGIQDYGSAPRQGFSRAGDIHTIISLLNFHHLGVLPTVDQQTVRDLSDTLIHDYYRTDWWKGHKADLQHSPESGERERERNSSGCPLIGSQCVWRLCLPTRNAWDGSVPG